MLCQLGLRPGKPILSTNIDADSEPLFQSVYPCFPLIHLFYPLGSN